MQSMEIACQMFACVTRNVLRQSLLPAMTTRAGVEGACKELIWCTCTDLHFPQAETRNGMEKSEEGGARGVSPLHEFNEGIPFVISNCVIREREFFDCYFVRCWAEEQLLEMRMTCIHHRCALMVLT